MASDPPHDPHDTFSTDDTVVPESTPTPRLLPPSDGTRPGHRTDPLADTHAGDAEFAPDPSTRQFALVDEGQLGMALDDPERYLTQELLGEGGIGRVLGAFDRHLAREVAFKVLRDDHGPPSAATRARFVNEARITGALEHPGVVPVYEVGQRADGLLYYTMPKIRGRTLADALKGASLADRLRLLPRFIDICQTMAYAHEHRVIHRDLKPDNVMLGPFGETMVLDWGLAKRLDGKGHGALTGDADDTDAPTEAEALVMASGQSAWRTMEGAFIGTPAYMSPEQARGDLNAIDTRSDVYTLGVMLFELLCGQTPFSGNSAIAVAMQVSTATVPAPRTLEPDCPPELEAIAMRALSKAPADRYPDAKAMAHDLVTFEAGGLVSAHVYGWQDLLARAWRRHKRRLVVGAVVLALGGGVWWVRGEAESRAAAVRRERAQARRLAEVERLFDELRQEAMTGALRTHPLRLIALQSPAVIDRLREALTDPHPGVRRAVAHALGGIGDPRTVPALVARLHEGGETDEDVVVEIIEALAAIGDSAADDPVYKIRRRYGTESPLWQRTETAFKMLPPAPVSEADQNNPEAWRAQGVRYVEKGRDADGEAAYLRAMALDPADPKAPSNLAIAYRRQRRFKDALAMVDRGLAAEPGFPWALANRAVILRHQGQYREALVACDRLVSQDKALTVLGLRSRARTRWALGDFEGALADVEAAVLKDPRGRQSAAVRGMYWAARGDWPQALANLDTAIELDGTFAMAFQQRGRIHAATGDWPAAHKDLRRALQIDPTLDEGRADLAGIARRLGRGRSALRHLGRAIALEPNEPLHEAALAVIGHAAEGEWGPAQVRIRGAIAKAMPGDLALFRLLAAGIAVGAGGRPDPTLLVPAGDHPWHDRLLAIVRGEQDPADAVADAFTPTMRGELALATWLVAGEAGLRTLPPPSGFATRPAPPSALAEALLDALRAPPK